MEAPSQARDTDLLPVSLDTDPAKARLYAELTRDYNLIHTDAGFAATTPFGVPIAHGTMALNLLLESIEKTWGDIPEGTEIVARFVRSMPVGSRLVAGGRRHSDSTQICDVFVSIEGGERTIEGTATLPGPG